MKTFNRPDSAVPTPLRSALCADPFARPTDLWQILLQTAASEARAARAPEAETLGGGRPPLAILGQQRQGLDSGRAGRALRLCAGIVRDGSVPFLVDRPVPVPDCGAH